MNYKSLFVGLLGVVLMLAGRSDALGLAGEVKHPGVALSQKLPGTVRQKISAALKRKDCKFLGGNFINSFTTLWYTSDTQALNLFMDDLKHIPQVLLHVSFVKELSRADAAWAVHHQASANRFQIRVALGGRIKIEEVYLPVIHGRDPIEKGDKMVMSGFEEFHQKAGRGWRAFAEKEMYAEAAGIIEQYLQRHGGLNEGEITSLHYFAAHNHAKLGGEKAITSALEHLKRARLKTEKETKGTISWNDMVALTEAELKNDDLAAKAARQRIKKDLKLPVSELDLEAVNKVLQQQLQKAIEAGRKNSALRSKREAGVQVRAVAVRVVHGTTGEPIPDAKLRVRHSTSSTALNRIDLRALDENGEAQIEIKIGNTATAEVVSDGFVGAQAMIGRLPGKNGTIIEAPVDTNAITMKVWPGTLVTGNIVRPDSMPARNVEATVGVYVTSWDWRGRLGLRTNRVTFSWDHGQWANWRTFVRTDEIGRFRATVPPAIARNWVRIGTTSLSFVRLFDAQLKEQFPKPLAAEFAPFELEYGHELEADGRLDVGEIRLDRGVILQGKVVDAQGKPMPNLPLMTSGKHGPYAGRETMSDDEGNFRFMPHATGAISLSVDARLRDDIGKVISRDVRAVFGKMPLTLSTNLGRIKDIVVQAEDMVTLEFDWIDRRDPPSDRISYYGEFKVGGNLPGPPGVPIYWNGATQKTTRDGKDIIFIKVPKRLIHARLQLATDKFVTARYEDASGLKGTGRIGLSDLDPDKHRTIYADPPK